MKPTWTSDCGRVQLYLGDCREILPTLGKVDAVVTDPPYGIGYVSGNSGNQFAKKFDAIEGDGSRFNPGHLLGFRDVLLFGANNFCDSIPPLVGQWYFWDKTLQNNGCRIAEGEFAWHKLGTKPRAFRHLWSGAYRDSESGEPSKHPTQKPVALFEWCLKLVKGDVVLDPYFGSGSCAVACIRTGRRFIGIEIEPRYFEIAKERIQRELAQPFLIEPKQEQPKQIEMV